MYQLFITSQHEMIRTDETFSSESDLFSYISCYIYRNFGVEFSASEIINYGCFLSKTVFSFDFCYLNFICFLNYTLPF